MAVLAVSNDLTTFHECDGTGGSGGTSLETDWYKEPSGCLGTDVDIATVFMTFTATGDWSNRNIYFWILSLTPPFLDTWKNGGIRIRLSDGTNTSNWYVGGRDTYFGGWKRFVVNTNASPDELDVGFDITSITSLDIGFKGIEKSRLSQNSFVDYIQYASVGTGITVTDGDGGEGFDAIVTADDAAYAGILSEEGGVFYLNGSINFGDTSTASIFFDDTDKLIATENWYREFTTTDRTSAESLVDSAFFQINVLGNATGTTEFTLGTKADSAGISGCIFKSTDPDAKIDFDVSNTNIDKVQMYGCNFQECGEFSLPPGDSSAREFINCSWTACGKVDAKTSDVVYCKFINSPEGAAALLLDSAINSTTDCEFIGCDVGVEISSTDSYSFNNMVFS